MHVWYAVAEILSMTSFIFVGLELDVRNVAQAIFYFIFSRTGFIIGPIWPDSNLRGSHSSLFINRKLFRDRDEVFENKPNLLSMVQLHQPC